MRKLFRWAYPAIPPFTPMSEGALHHVSVARWAEYRLAEWEYNRVLRVRDRTEACALWIVGMACIFAAVFTYAASL